MITWWMQSSSQHLRSSHGALSKQHSPDKLYAGFCYYKLVFASFKTS